MITLTLKVDHADSQVGLKLAEALSAAVDSAKELLGDEQTRPWHVVENTQQRDRIRELEKQRDQLLTGYNAAQDIITAVRALSEEWAHAVSNVPKYPSDVITYSKAADELRAVLNG